MDRALKGHPYVKSAIDMACWDLLGKAANLPVAELMGGRTAKSIPLYRAISQDSPGEMLTHYPYALLLSLLSYPIAEAMAANVAKYVDEGYRKFQLKVGGSID